jgi:hypothetical protein
MSDDSTTENRAADDATPETQAHAKSPHSAQPSDAKHRAPSVPADFPITRLLVVHIAAGAGLVILWAVVHQGWNFAPAIYKGVLLGLCAATAAHLLGTVIGAVLTPGKGLAAAYLASTVARFMLTPILALSLYFLLLAEARPVLIGSLVGYLLILVADIVMMMRAMQPTSQTAS